MKNDLKGSKNGQKYANSSLNRGCRQKTQLSLDFPGIPKKLGCIAGYLKKPGNKASLVDSKRILL